MIYKVSEDQAGRVTLSEINPVTRRVERSVRLEPSVSERLLTFLSQAIPTKTFVRRRKHADASAVETSSTLFDYLNGTNPCPPSLVSAGGDASDTGARSACSSSPARRMLLRRPLAS